MIDHLTMRVNDIEKTKAFYSKALEPIGYKLAFEETFGGTRVIGFSHNEKIDV